MSPRVSRVAGALLRLAWGRLHRDRPMILSHMVTGRCNCRCETCLWRSPGSPELSTQAMRTLYEDAAELGYLGTVLWGGEPLMRSDLPELADLTAKLGFFTVLITNATLLPRRLGEFRTFPDLLVLSVDHPEPGVHDRMRGAPGTWENARASVRLVRERFPGTTVTVNSVVSRMNGSELRRLALLAKDWGVGIYLCPMETDLPRSDGFGDAKAALALPAGELAEACRKILRMKREGLPIQNSDAYLRTFIPGKRRFRCHYQKMVTQIQATGIVEDCSARDVPLGDLRRERLARVMGRAETKSARERSVRCNVCNNPDVIETSYFYDLAPGVILEKLRWLSSARR